jgi:5,10-methylene-tetrahydrofolate dehydrogenase/methenyl tetrahydrofolate cyclohydrolase
VFAKRQQHSFFTALIKEEAFMATIMDGAAFSEAIKPKVKEDTEDLGKAGISAGFALLLAGNNPACRLHFLATGKAAEKAGIRETPDLAHFSGQANIVCSASGRQGPIKGDMIKKGAIVVDIGIPLLWGSRIVGDVDYASSRDRASFINPFPGGVGPVTISILPENAALSLKPRVMMDGPL